MHSQEIMDLKINELVTFLTQDILNFQKGLVAFCYVCTAPQQKMQTLFRK
jgi:hypothetical protein